jgi:ABC-type multidrug transport system ATPase subunit
MGPSGAGKTTLLKALTLDVDRFGTAVGSLTLNGSVLTPKTFSRRCGLVAQEDHHWSFLTCKETVSFAAEFFLSGHTQQVKEQRVLHLLTKMGLDSCANTIVGNVFIKGLSGGQKRRLSLAIVLMKRLDVLMLDEPTSGLDAASAAGIMKFIGEITRSERLISIFTIHQPSTCIYDTFDRIMLLSAGRVAYCGPRKEVLSYFQRIRRPVPDHTNPAEFMLDVVNKDFSDAAEVEAILQAWLDASRAAPQELEVLPPMPPPVVRRPVSSFSRSSGAGVVSEQQRLSLQQHMSSSLEEEESGLDTQYCDKHQERRETEETKEKEVTSDILAGEDGTGVQLVALRQHEASAAALAVLADPHPASPASTQSAGAFTTVSSLSTSTSTSTSLSPCSSISLESPSTSIQKRARERAAGKSRARSLGRSARSHLVPMVNNAPIRVKSTCGTYMCASTVSSIYPMLRRHALLCARDPLLYSGRIVMFFISCTFFSIIYVSARHRNQSHVLQRMWFIIWILAVPTNMAVSAVYAYNNEFHAIKREVKNGMVDPVSYILATALLQIPFMFLFALSALSLSAYGIIEFNGQRFGQIVFIYALLMYAYETLAQLMALLFDNPLLGMLNYLQLWFGSFLFSGLFVTITEIVWPFRVLYYVLPFQYCAQAIIYQEFVGKPFQGAVLCDPLSADSSEVDCLYHSGHTGSEQGWACPTSTTTAAAGADGDTGAPCYGREGWQVLESIGALFDMVSSNVNTGRNVAIIVSFSVCAKLLYSALLIYKSTASSSVKNIKKD